jgi:hypothetical protein
MVNVVVPVNIVPMVVCTFKTQWLEQAELLDLNIDGWKHTRVNMLTLIL